MRAKSSTIAVRPVADKDDLRRATELMIRVHHDAGDSAHRWLENGAVRYPGYRSEHTRVASQDHHILGTLRLTTDTIRIGEARLKMGGLGWVATAPEYRNRGVCRLLIDDTVRYMQDNGYHVSMLFGIPNFYHRFGYTTALADHSVTMDTLEALTFEHPFKVLRAKPGDLQAIQSMHDSNDEAASCSIVRSRGHLMNKWGRYGEDNWYVLKDDRGRMAAYLFVQAEKDLLGVWEVGVEESGVCAGIVAAAGAIADAASLPRIKFYVPPDNVFAKYMQQFASVHETRYLRDAGGMMRLIDASETLECMIPEWESALARTHYPELRAEATLLVNGGSYRIRANKGVIDVASTTGPNKVTLSPHDLMHLITGYRQANDYLHNTRTLITPDARALLTTIFPKRFPYVWMFDRF